MSVNSDKSKEIKKILKVLGEESLVTHVAADSEDSLLKSSSDLGARNSNQELSSEYFTGTILAI